MSKSLVTIVGWTVVALLLLSFVPYVEECTYDDDVGYCEDYYPYQMTWWQRADEALFSAAPADTAMSEVQWDSWGRFYLWQEGVVDLYRTLTGDM